MHIFKYAVLLLLLLSVMSCTVTEEPTFVKVKDIYLKKLNNNEYALNGQLVYHNPNDVGGTLTNINLKLNLDEYFLGDFNKDLNIPIVSNSDFEVPLSHNIDFSKLKLDQELFTLLLSAAMSKEVDFSYKGDVKLKIAGVQFTLPVESSQTIPFSKKLPTD